MRRIVLFVVACVLGAVAVAGCSASADNAKGPSPEKALDFSATTVDGAAFQGSSLEGKPTVLWFWAPWCPTCRNQAPAVAALAKTYAGRVNVVGVGSLDESAAIKEFAAAVPADVTELADPDGAVWKHFGVTAQSTYVVLDADHRIVKSGSLSDDDLAQAVAGLVS